MATVLIRDVPHDDLDLIRAVAAERGTSLQGILREAVIAQAAHLRRSAALARSAERLGGRPAVPERVRDAVLEAVDAEQTERAGALGDPGPR